jgi:hypothetical protein
LSRFNDKKLNTVLIANLLHPNEMIRQLAGYVLYKNDRDLFYKEVNQNYPVVERLKEFSEDIEKYVSGDKRLIFKKLIKIKKLVFFEEIPEEQLVELATNFEEIYLQNHQAIEFDLDQTDFMIISKGEIIDESSGMKYSVNDLICPIFNSTHSKINGKVISETAIVIKTKLHYITGFFSQYEGFAKELFNTLLGGNIEENSFNIKQLGTKNANIQV